MKTLQNNTVKNSIRGILIFTVILFIAYLKINNLIGFCMSNSMSPTIEKGDLFFVMKTTELQIGDIIAFKPESYDLLVIHRIYDMNSSVIITKGDANLYVDPVHPEQIFGKVVFIIPNGLYFYYLTLVSLILIILMRKDVKKK